ncbi:UDP-forming cellulose synthase catalytic subunit [Bordetella genomosp. 11]|uniref:Cellulose synthase catalytic subunit [UDP-forming] n=1 Tax=Bordetella genomosp. 11 TaxID=1416808 RepID=A0A261UWF3_9BORD|nr:UDP-forming cellulose synthase catalytic subunit [Bordetella genomosp. 11]OZI66216.1 UDP-forming cellulose synthase catalytic subunit [Bordetella genomosp. 11]
MKRRQQSFHYPPEGPAPGDRLLQRGVWTSRPLRAAIAVLAALLVWLTIVIPLTLEQQLVFCVVTFLFALCVRRVAGQLTVLTLIVLSCTASLRYMYWRLTATLDFDNLTDMLFGWGLVLAECYALAVLLLGYLQTAWPLRRKPVPLPRDSNLWPSVDIFIPTYNEPLNVVRQTVYTALTMDWPADKLRVYLLDDGRRDAFREFCEEVGAGYITREDNRHAKAGNLNWALKQTQGEYVAIFDCDHVPTRSFLQMCMGWFLKDEKLAMLQTPHFFFSADPFEKNLRTGRAVPNEGELFYGLVQDGNDLWNAAFFCGSCAILKRGPLEEVGGVAVETVTEDAHTALKLSRAGYNTAFLGIPQAAGLATESLSAHIGQRIRWARGMAQIFRVDNPLAGKGLSFGQRLCYLNAMLHFFYGLPRIVFLTAPLAYLFFGAHVFQASALMITAYALPHLLHASLTNSRIQGRFRHSFWNEVYESVLAWYIMRPVMLALINPKLGKFNVTAKGGVIEQSYFDWTMARPYIVLLLLNLAGMAAGLAALAFGHGDTDVKTTICINLAWTVYNIVITSASVAVAAENRQLRGDPRVAAQLPAMVRLPDGKTVACETSDFSQTGLGLVLPRGARVALHEQVQISIFRGREEGVFPATAVFSRDERVGLRFDALSVAQQVELAQLTFARADTWASGWGNRKPDAPLAALLEVTKIGAHGFALLLRHFFHERFRAHRRAEAATPAVAAQTSTGTARDR